MLFLPACSPAFGGWDGEMGRGREKKNKKKPPMAGSPWNNWHLSRAASPRPPARLRGHRRLPSCSAHARERATRGQPNDFPTTLLTSGTPLPAWHLPCPPAPPPLQPPNELDRFQCLKAHLTTPFCLGTLSLDLIFIDSAVPRGGGCGGFQRILQ